MKLRTYVCDSRCVFIDQNGIPGLYFCFWASSYDCHEEMPFVKREMKPEETTSIPRMCVSQQRNFDMQCRPVSVIADSQM